MQDFAENCIVHADWRFSGCGNLLMCLWLMLEVLAESHREHVQENPKKIQASIAFYHGGAA